MTWAAALLAAARMAPVAWLAPPLGGRSLGARAVIGAVLTALVWPAVAGATVDGALLPLIAREALVGVALGLVSAVPFRAAEAAGALADVARRGRSAGRDPLADAYLLFALALYAALDGPRLLLTALAQSYAAFPVGAAPLAASGVTLALEAGARLVAAAATLAAPVLAALLLAELVVGLVARADRGVGGAVGLGGVRTLALVAALGAGLTLLGRALAADGRTAAAAVRTVSHALGAGP